MMHEQSISCQKKLLWKDRNFYRGVLSIPLLAAVGFIVMVSIRPSSTTSFLLQWVYCGLLLAVTIGMMIRFRRFGLGMMLGWILFILFPIVWVMVLGFSGNLMS